jgi:hypothetical protein
LCREHCIHVDGIDASTPEAGPPDAGTPDAGPVCREGTFELTRMQLDLMMVIDDTASVSPWLPALYDGFDQFITEKASSGIGVGLQRFDEICDAAEYARPIVSIARLPGNQRALQNAAQLMLTASTSTTPALDGVHRYARSWAVSHPDHRVVVVLLTDASPGACDGLVGDWDAEAQRIAREALQGTPSIKTYVVGFGTMDAVVAIAQAGGTTPALINVTPADGEVQLALDNVRNAEQACAFNWQAGWTLAPTSQVVVTVQDGKERRYPILRDAAACDQQDGFYIEDAAAYPLVACPRSCAGLATARATLSAACAAP